MLAERLDRRHQGPVPGGPLARSSCAPSHCARALTTSPATRARQRALWETAGVIVDDLASQVLVLNLRGQATACVGDWLSDAAEFGVPFRLTLHQLHPMPAVPAADASSSARTPPCCGRGRRARRGQCAPWSAPKACRRAACHTVLASRRTRRAAALARDFDWAGLRITAAAVTTATAPRPWRMTAADYRDALAQGDIDPLAAPRRQPVGPGARVAHGRNTAAPSWKNASSPR